MLKKNRRYMPLKNKNHINTVKDILLILTSISSIIFGVLANNSWKQNVYNIVREEVIRKQVPELLSILEYLNSIKMEDNIGSSMMPNFVYYYSIIDNSFFEQKDFMEKYFYNVYLETKNTKNKVDLKYANPIVNYELGLVYDTAIFSNNTQLLLNTMEKLMTNQLLSEGMQDKARNIYWKTSNLITDKFIKVIDNTLTENKKTHLDKQELIQYSSSLVSSDVDEIRKDINDFYNEIATVLRIEELFTIK